MRMAQAKPRVFKHIGIPHEHEYLLFETGHYLMIVAGKQDAVFYSIGDGFITRLRGFRIERPRYSDNEGRFDMRAGGKLLRTGSVRERHDEAILTDFIHELKLHIHGMHGHYDGLYIFAPAQTKRRIPEALPDQLKRKIRCVVQGNYYHTNPRLLLTKLIEKRRLF